MDKTLEERCKQFGKFIYEYYSFNKYYLCETAKDALLNALDCIELLAGERGHLPHNFPDCDSHLPYITQLAYDKYLTDQTKEAFYTAQEALIEVFVHRKQNE